MVILTNIFVFSFYVRTKRWSMYHHHSISLLFVHIFPFTLRDLHFLMLSCCSLASFHCNLKNSLNFSERIIWILCQAVHKYNFFRINYWSCILLSWLYHIPEVFMILVALHFCLPIWRSSHPFHSLQTGLGRESSTPVSLARDAGQASCQGSWVGLLVRSTVVAWCQNPQRGFLSLSSMKELVGLGDLSQCCSVTCWEECDGRKVELFYSPS